MKMADEVVLAQVLMKRAAIDISDRGNDWHKLFRKLDLNRDGSIDEVL